VRFAAEQGVINAILLPHTIRFNASATTECLAQIAADAGTDWFLFQNPGPVSDPTALLDVLTAAW
jgi:hypothetical protein